MKQTKFEIGTTEDFAKIHLVKPETVRRAHSVNGAYCGIKPIEKLPNGRLKWPLVGSQEEVESGGFVG